MRSVSQIHWGDMI
ncbi:hypothetical protein Bhyg_06611, partial [Pseudolycoriella hygida]